MDVEAILNLFGITPEPAEVEEKIPFKRFPEFIAGLDQTAPEKYMLEFSTKSSKTVAFTLARFEKNEKVFYLICHALSYTKASTVIEILQSLISKGICTVYSVDEFSDIDDGLFYRIAAGETPEAAARTIDTVYSNITGLDIKNMLFELKYV